MKLIDVDKLIEDLEYDVELDARELDDIDLLLGRDRELVQFDKDCKQNAINMLKNTLTVDAQPVRYGKWKKIRGAINCSACKSSSWSMFFEDLVTSFNYCPNCGAKMDAEQEKQNEE